MKIYRSLEEIEEQPQPSIATIGVFDGVHRAHQALLDRVCQLARARQARSLAITFDPHPVAILAPGKQPKLLTPLPIKLELLRRSGVEALLILPFTEALSRWSAEHFVDQVLHRALRAAGVVVGENFHFGHRQSGNPQLLQALGPRYQFFTEVLPSLHVRGWTVSSSQIRCLLEEGRVAIAGRLLGRVYSIRGPIVSGLGVGHKQAVPTFNLGECASLIPARGVYVTAARLGCGSEEEAAPELSDPLRSVANIGTRPTFGNRPLGVEAHLLDAWEGPAPSLLEAGFLFRLRDERKFDSPEQLKEQISRDILRAQAYFRLLRRWVHV